MGYHKHAPVISIFLFLFYFIFPLTTQKDKTKKKCNTLEISDNLKTIT